ncbi:MAG: hypothetical protein HQ551_07060 [Desulfobacteraceae bacterium]|nr:hypothetical protein [Desulfobacteraceae bacterium]
MRRNNLFFKRQEFNSDTIRKAYYEYKGYCSLSEERDEYYPIVLHFGKDEIVFSYHDGEGRINRLFSLYVAQGELNQRMLREKIQHYWKMPLWPTPKDKERERQWKSEEKEKKKFFINRGLLSISYFSSLHEFDLINDEFVKCRLFDHRGVRHDFELYKDRLRFSYLLKQRDRKPSRDEWIIKKGKVETQCINFRKILLDFLYELEYTNTFEDENFFSLQPALQDNKLLDALSRKCRYLDELFALRDYRRNKPNNNLPKKFRTAEDSWLNACFLESYQEVFTSPDSVFGSAEDEAELVIFKTRIGATRRKRSACFIKGDSRLRNNSATFFLQRYSLYNAFKVLMHPAYIFALLALILLIPLGDFILGLKIDHGEAEFSPLVGIFGVVLPMLGLVALVINYALRRINLFKLVLPRLFLGIMLGWSVFWSTEELWKEALIANAPKILVVNLVLFVILFLYIFTDIRNKLVRLTDCTVLKRTAGLISLAMLISFLLGFYVIQFKAKPMLENSEFLEKLGSIKKPGIDTELNKFNKTLKFQNTSVESAGYSQYSGRLFGFDNFTSIKLRFNDYRLRYIWSIHLSQFMMSILIGIILLLLWEDRPITEPL